MYLPNGDCPPRGLRILSFGRPPSAVEGGMPQAIGLLPFGWCFLVALAGICAGFADIEAHDRRRSGHRRQGMAASDATRPVGEVEDIARWTTDRSRLRRFAPSAVWIT
jgi:hypothetical protein